MVSLIDCNLSQLVLPQIVRSHWEDVVQYEIIRPGLI